jgi:hypothetical protein
VILSPLVTLCYTNSRWGSTRPFIKQCGHAAHFKCVETHTISLHQRAENEQTYDGRFAANIGDGEFLCPLCKQLSNILIPRSNVSHEAAASKMDIDEESSDSPVTAGHRPLRDVLISACTVSLSSTERKSKLSEALDQFGSKLYSAMSVPWERGTVSQRKHLVQWNQAIHKWDYEDEGGSEKNALRLLRQQLIAWSAVGHSAAALEASTRSIEEVLPFGVFSQTSDPWSGFDSKAKDNHPMLLELKRTLTGSSGLLRLLCRDVADQLTSEDNGNAAIFIGVCLADILDGRSWIQRTPTNDLARAKDHATLWSSLTALISAIPCHVARDGTIPQRSEARASAAAMWAVKGLGKESPGKGEVPAPLAIQHLPGNLALGSGWGTMDPFVRNLSDSDITAFRPGIASAFLHLPLLSWDLYTLSAALFSALLSSPANELPSSKEILMLARSLVAGRIVQAIVTPCGFDEPDEMELDEEDCWNPEEVKVEGAALARLVAHCRSVVKMKSVDEVLELVGDSKDLGTATLLAGVGRAILPFSRALILVLRACMAAVRERQKTGTKQTEEDKILDALTCRKDLMTIEDGFHIVKAMDGPKPGDLVDSSMEWWAVINRWLVAAVGLELHHGSAGRVILPSQVASSLGSLGMMEDRNLTESPAPSSGASGVMDVGVSTSLSSNVGRSEDVDDNGDDMDVNASEEDVNDVIVMVVGGAGPRAMQAHHDEDDDTDDEMMHDVEMGDAEDFSEQLMGLPSFAQPAGPGNAEAEDSSDEYSSSDAEGDDNDREFAHVSKSPILYYQPSLLGLQLVGPGRKGAAFDLSGASAVMSDLSHLGSVHQRSTSTFCLVRLPKSFVELYNMVSRVKGRDESSGLDEGEDLGNSETAICLLTGAVMRSGSTRRPFSRTARQPGACTMHARRTGSGIGIFFLVQKCTVLLMHNNKSAYSPSLYVDTHGEEDPGLKRGRPLFLNEERYRSLELLWRQQGIPGEVAQIRSTSDRVIRDNWY